MAFSSWKIWLHPRLTRRVMESHEEEQRSLSSECTALREEILGIRRDFESIVASNAELKQSNSALSAEKSRLESEAGALRKRLEDADLELSERKSAEEQIREFDSVLSRAEDMKRGYELRIARLRSIINDMKKASGESNPEADEIAVIDMDPVRPSAPRRPLAEEAHSDEEWLEELPE